MKYQGYVKSTPPRTTVVHSDDIFLNHDNSLILLIKLFYKHLFGTKIFFFLYKNIGFI